MSHGGMEGREDLTMKSHHVDFGIVFLLTMKSHHVDFLLTMKSHQDKNVIRSCEHSHHVDFGIVLFTDHVHSTCICALPGCSDSHSIMKQLCMCSLNHVVSHALAPRCSVCSCSNHI